MFKLLFKWVTGQCELLRITYSNSRQVDRVKRIESSLRLSRSIELKKCADSSDTDVALSVEQIQKLKNIAPEAHPQFQVSLKDSLQRISAHNQIIVEAEYCRKIKFSSDNADHEEKLTKLWRLYNADRVLPSRVGQHWTEIGFQGDDPATDFRGMGLLGLDQLIFFAEAYPQQALQVLSQSHHPQFGFSFSIVGINMTEMCVTLLNKRRFSSYFYSFEKPKPGLTDFHRIYCHIFHGFAQFWFAERPESIMEFGRVREDYLQKVNTLLDAENTVLLSEFQQS
ncbi:ELMO domain-containing protein 2 [Elysia marginata]|uniref:ELMO domain-containing protein 2 n=1 Tax=Elysia marginata TaxID=1093978 RepID=A0AAV4JIM0_9GAST|nr:ELMO domain-containing protein 2 [Elysia marginata]